jgi:Kef-type K+ transport system membrane component KefB
MDLIWPFALLIAWLFGELINRWTGLPRISAYAVIGFLLGFLPAEILKTNSNIVLLANISFGLILFEAGYRINIHWLKNNIWIGLTAIFENLLTFCAVFILAKSFHLSTTISFLLSTLSMATSPATILRVINEQQSSGQVTERILHFSVFSCVLAIFIFKLFLNFSFSTTMENYFWILSFDFLNLLISIAIGVFFGIFSPLILNILKPSQLETTTIFYAIVVIFLVFLTHSLKLSPILATLMFGLMTRHRRMILSPSQRSFGTLGVLLSILLFVFIASILEWSIVAKGLLFGILLIATRFIAKTVAIECFARNSGITFKKGFLVALSMTPISAFIILLFEQTRYLGLNLFEQLFPLTAAALIMELLAPIFIQHALFWSKELPQRESDDIRI